MREELILIIVALLTILILVNYECQSNFESKLEYAGDNFKYENDPTASNFNYPTFKDNAVFVPNSNMYVNRNLYAIP